MPGDSPGCALQRTPELTFIGSGVRPVDIIRAGRTGVSSIWKERETIQVLLSHHTHEVR